MMDFVQIGTDEQHPDSVPVVTFIFLMLAVQNASVIGDIPQGVQELPLVLRIPLEWGAFVMDVSLFAWMGWFLEERLGWIRWLVFLSLCTCGAAMFLGMQGWWIAEPLEWFNGMAGATLGAFLIVYPHLHITFAFQNSDGSVSESDLSTMETSLILLAWESVLLLTLGLIWGIFAWTDLLYLGGFFFGAGVCLMTPRPWRESSKVTARHRDAGASPALRFLQNRIKKLVKKKDFEKALELVEDEYHHNPQDPILAHYYAQLNLRFGSHHTAAEVLLETAKFHVRQANWTELRRCLQVLKTDFKSLPLPIEPSVELAQALARRLKRKEAQEILERACQWGTPPESKEVLLQAFELAARLESSCIKDIARALLPFSAELDSKQKDWLNQELKKERLRHKEDQPNVSG